jgi:hypothetical protein
MAQAGKQPSTATRRIGGSQPTPTGQGPRGDQDQQNARVERDDRDKQRGELGDRREPGSEPGDVQRTLEQVTDRVRSATSNPADAFALTPDMSKVLTAWFDMAGDMMKLQQQFFSTVLEAGNTDDRNTTKV